jgi:hypothetical protein
MTRLCRSERRCYVAFVDARGRDVIAAELRATASAEGWPPWRVVQTICRKAGTPTLLMAWRLASGHTQSEVSAGIQGLAADNGEPCAPNPSCQQLSRWENGHEVPGSFYRRYLALWYRAPLARLGLVDEHPLVTLEEGPRAQVEEDNVDRRQFLSLAAATPVFAHLDTTRQRMESDLRRVLPAADIDHWWDIAASHVISYARVPPTQLLERLAPDLDEIANLAARYPHQRDLHLITSRLCGLTGALHTDLDQDRPARDWLHTAARYGELSGNNGQRYWVAMAQALSALYGPQPAQVIRITARARTKLGEPTSAPAVQLTGLAARAYARLGDAEHARRELDRALTLFDGLGKDQTDAEFFGFPAAELDMYAEQVLTVIDDPQAWDAQSRALAVYPDDDPMDRPLILFDRARYLARQGEAEEAAQTAGHAITSLPQPMRVPLLMAQARDVGDHIARISGAVAADYRERVLT